MGSDDPCGDEPGKVCQKSPLFLASLGFALYGGNFPELDPENLRKSNTFNSASGKLNVAF